MVLGVFGVVVFFLGVSSGLHDVTPFGFLGGLLAVLYCMFVDLRLRVFQRTGCCRKPTSQAADTTKCRANSVCAYGFIPVHHVPKVMFFWSRGAGPLSFQRTLYPMD